VIPVTTRSTPKLGTWPSRVALAILAVVLGTQCTSRYETYCENQRACRGGNDKDVDACIEGARAEENIAAAYDCEEPFDAVAKCLETAPCRDQRLDTSACGEQQRALSACKRAASGKGSGGTSSGSTPDGG
jgi:hypothetical protein